MTDIQNKVNITPRRFQLLRTTDLSGVSGTGIVAYGVMFGDCTAVIRWNSVLKSTAMYSHIDDVVSIHGHEGATELVWID